MNTIRLQETLPQVFATLHDVESDIWRQNVVLEQGKTYLVEANSGTGKSSLCSYIYGYRRDYQGHILFDNTDIAALTVSRWVDLRRHSLSLLWQELRLFPELTAWENVSIKNSITHHQKESKINAWFDELGIADRRDTLVAHMSFGQQQRVALIRALCQPFDFIFADEPISHLDDSNSRIVGSILTTEARRQGAGVIVTSIGKHLDIEYDKTLKL